MATDSARFSLTLKKAVLALFAALALVAVSSQFEVASAGAPDTTVKERTSSDGNWTIVTVTQHDATGNRSSSYSYVISKEEQADRKKKEDENNKKTKERADKMNGKKGKGKKNGSSYPGTANPGCTMC